jgi:hypothetical protein
VTAAEPMKSFVDKASRVSFSVPESWELSENELQGGRRLVAAVDPSDNDLNAFVAFTPIQADYPSLGSFGTIDYVAGTILPECNKALCTLDTDGVEGKMLEQAVVRGNYIFDYTIATSGQPTRHLRTVFSIQTEEGRGKALITLTAQCLQSKHTAAQETLKAVCDSFKFV